MAGFPAAQGAPSQCDERIGAHECPALPRAHNPIALRGACSKALQKGSGDGKEDGVRW